MQEEVKIIRCAWQAWCATNTELKMVFAITPEEARAKYKSIMGLHNKTSIYLNRISSEDILEFEGREIRRNQLEDLLHTREVQQKRKAFVETQSDDTLFIIQNQGYVGNNIKFWGVQGAGYTTNLDKAKRFTKEQVLIQFVNGREEDIIWLASELEAKAALMVDHQLLDYSKSTSL